ncbi:myosin heavy chain, muscle [Nematostella vectensis]|uniref:myosin heavy chain, muscle n=1 Tax=Nematostella vectensis TaxID=45351 RepID=UPI0020778448|nr:myosin heavy chain, muscle [Nematostella vectensis]
MRRFLSHKKPDVFHEEVYQFYFQKNYLNCSQLKMSAFARSARFGCPSRSNMLRLKFDKSSLCPRKVVIPPSSCKRPSSTLSKKGSDWKPPVIRGNEAVSTQLSAVPDNTAAPACRQESREFANKGSPDKITDTIKHSTCVVPVISGARIQEDLKHYKQQTETLESLFAAVNHNNENLINENLLLQAELDNLNNELKAKDNRIESLQDELERMENEKTELRVELRGAERSTEATKGVMATMKEMLRKNDEQKLALQKYIDDLELENSELTSQLGRSLENLKHLDQIHENTAVSSENALERISGQVDVLNTALKKLREENSRLKSKLGAIKDHAWESVPKETPKTSFASQKVIKLSSPSTDLTLDQVHNHVFLALTTLSQSERELISQRNFRRLKMVRVNLMDALNCVSGHVIGKPLGAPLIAGQVHHC